MNALRILRSVLAVIIGLFLISALVEGVEFALVGAIHGQPITNPEEYYAIRNLPWFLGLKLIYNSLAAIAGGYISALIAGYAKIKHGVALAGIQTLAFIWAIVQPDLGQRLAVWFWMLLIFLSVGGILLGAVFQARGNQKGKI